MGVSTHPAVVEPAHPGPGPCWWVWRWCAPLPASRDDMRLGPAAAGCSWLGTQEHSTGTTTWWLNSPCRVQVCPGNMAGRLQQHNYLLSVQNSEAQGHSVTAAGVHASWLCEAICHMHGGTVK